MATAYVGTADCYGLEWFLPEEKDAIAAVSMRAFDGPLLRRAPFWATVSDELARQVRCQLRAGERLRALVTLEAHALEIAPMYPCIELRYSVNETRRCGFRDTR
jgi:hypothetical protein